MSPINPRVEKFVACYLACGDEVQAFRETFKGTPRFNSKTLKRDAALLLMDRDVKESLALASRAALRTKRLDAKEVLGRLAQLAFADVTKIAKIRRVNCRHCWGKGFKRQGTQGEYDDAVFDAIVAAQKAGKAEYDAPSPPPGGLGFDMKRAPHPDCPECGGEGHAELLVNDFDSLDEDVKPLISGVKEGKYGLEISFHDQRAALETLAKCFGLMQPDVAIQIINQMAPPKDENLVIDMPTIDKAQETYRRLIDGSN